MKAAAKQFKKLQASMQIRNIGFEETDCHPIEGVRCNSTVRVTLSSRLCPTAVEQTLERP
jgi:hypothetical protein